ncbi:hypothetical protein [Gelidibacter sp.]|uniref:hypothetical protein n=1 Tax=Gelidibacter sp. TaxID=2018083 RepID=UPI003267CF02
MLLNKFWIRINENNLTEKWYFKENGELIISIDGNIIDGRYELLDESNLILEYEKNRILLNHNFIYKDLLLLKKDSNESEFYAFYDSTKFINSSQFLKFIETSRKRDLNIKKIILSDNTEAEIVREPNQDNISLGNSVIINQKLTAFNLIETDNNIYELQNGVINNILYKGNYKINDNNITVKQKWRTIDLNDEIIYSSIPVKNGKHKINYNLGLEIVENRIRSKYHIRFCETFYHKRKLEIWCRNSTLFSYGNYVFENGKSLKDGKYWISLVRRIKVENGKLK